MFARRLGTFVSHCLILSAFCTLSALAQTSLPADTASRIDEAAAGVLASTGVPSASVAIVRNGEVAYLHAYGKARLEPALAADPAMQYSVGSISKQFTAAAVLLWCRMASSRSTTRSPSTSLS